MIRPLFFAAALGLAAAAPAAPAPDFSLPAADGSTHALTDHRGSYVVLEWLNHGCPFVRKHYASGNMQALQERLTGQDVVWLSVVSSAPGKQGHDTASGHVATARDKGSRASAILLDEAGTVGRAYGARTTPQMVVIDPAGAMVYQGAIDDRPTADPADVEGARNYVLAALDAARAGQPADPAATQPYGCAVKY